MRRKLSQPPPTSARPPGGPLLLMALSIGLLALSTIGCREGVASRAGEGEGPASSPGEDSGSLGAGAGDTPFVWPESPDHPVIALQIEGPTGPGRVEIELMPELAPRTVEKILELVDEGFYDGTTFHRVIADFMIQGGDPNTRDRNPNNDGKGGPGFTLEDEFSRAPFERGVVGIGNRGRPDSGGSQFFIMHADDPQLAGRYTVIGRVRSGIEVVDAITQVPTDKVGRWGPKDRPIQNVVVRHVARTSGVGEAESLASAVVEEAGG